MRPVRAPERAWWMGRRGARFVCIGGILAALGCNGSSRSWFFFPRSAPEPTDQILDADTPFTEPDPRPAVALGPPGAIVSASARISILHVRIPRSEQPRTELLWNHLREDALGSEVVFRLRKNGLRVGIGRREWWGAVKAILDAIDGHRVSSLEPIRIAPGFPLGLELDAEPHDQNLWVYEADGVLSGESWPKSRNFLRLIYTLDRQRPERIFLAIVPEVRQRLPGWRWVRTEDGLWQTPKHGGRAFPAAGFRVALEPGEFLVIAPSADADIAGLIGSSFLTEEDDGPRLDSYIFISPDLKHVRQPG